MASKAVIFSIIALLVVVAGVIIFMQSGSQDTGTNTGEQQGVQTGEQQTETETLPETQLSVTEFVIEADDRGFYIDGADISSISAGSGEALKITFNVRSTGVYYGGLDFRGCTLNTGKVNPGSSTTVEFKPASTCTITSYWPSSGVVKDRLQVSVA